MDGDVDAVVCGVGSGGTITGLSRYFARVSPHTEMVLADPAGSSLAEYVRTGQLGPGGSYAVEGIGQSSVPPVADLSRVLVPTRSPMRAVSKSLALCFGRPVFSQAPPAGTLLAAAIEYCREQP